jgi:hypothetical protein
VVVVDSVAVFTRAPVVVLALAIGIVPIAPPEHVHESSEPDHHTHAVAHRHTRLHSTAAPVTADHHHDDAVQSDHDDAVVMLDQAFTQALDRVVLALPATIAIGILRPPESPRRTGVPAYVERLIHGPPRGSSSLRAPPISPAI